MKPIQTLCLVRFICVLSRNFTSMAVKSSSSHRAMESPFSHLEMYGFEHPSSSRVKHKSKKFASKSSKMSEKRVKPTTIRSASSVSSWRSDISTVSAVSSSSNDSKQEKKRSVTVSLTTTRSARNDATGITKVDHDSPVLRKHDRTRLNGAWTHVKNSGIRPTTRKSSLNPKSPSSGSKTSKMSLLAQSSSAMSTSEVLLRFNKDSGRPISIDCSANVRINRTAKKNVYIPPHMHLPRRAFDTDLTRGRPTQGNGTAKSGSLTIKDIGMGLGKMQYRNVIVMSGAGISTASGIPDFRYMHYLYIKTCR